MPASRTRTKWMVVLACGLVAGVVTAIATGQSGEVGLDYWQHWFAVRTLFEGGDPYRSITPNTLRSVGDTATAFGNLYFYPLPATVLGVPFALFDADVAAVLFSASSWALLAFAFRGDADRAFPMLLSAAGFASMRSAQVSPLLIAATLTPALGVLLVSKPTLGAALWTYRPARAPVLAGMALCIFFLAVNPGWPLEWIAAARRSPHHHIPLATTVAGPLLLLAALRWRRPEARLLLALSVVPQLLLFYDQLPLWLVPASRRQRLTLTYTSWAGFLLWFFIHANRNTGEIDVRLAAPYVLLGCYLPALAMVLRAPNQGDLPVWLERKAALLPAWLRGRPGSSSEAERK